MRNCLPRAATAALAALALIAASASAADSSGQAPPLGFVPTAGADELGLEQRFDGELNPADQRAWLQQLSAEPNQVGSPHDRANAERLRDLMSSWGWQTQIETFQVLFPTPRRESLELVSPGHFTASLHEPPVPGDATSSITSGLPPYNAYGGDGDVTGPLVYVNYGMQDDYKELARHGVDVRGKIVIARYGGGWRGLKPKLAQEHGAIGCIIYSDPRDDGYFAGEPYPKGGWRPPEGVQRGSVQDMTLYPGDPLTPGVGALPNARRLSVQEARTILKIPSLPISYADAQPLLAALAGPVAPPAWRGALPLTYRLGPGPATVHLVVISDWNLKPVYDVIGRIPGAQAPDEWVVRGNHHDGWVFGAWDPLSGAVAELAEAKAIGALLKSGWRPARTLIYASWDGEEPGLLGSTEWVEAHAEELERHAVAYVNTDDNGRGFLSAQGSQSLQRLVNEVAGAVRDPETPVSLAARLRARWQVSGFAPGASEEDKAHAGAADAGGDLPIAALGSGSDYSAFIEHLGIASLNFGFSGEDAQAGVYHSLYDSFDHYVRFGDPGMHYGVALSQVVGRVVLRLADAEVLPLQFGGFADAIGRYTHEVHVLADTRREHAERLAKLLDEKAFTLASDPEHPQVAPEREAAVPYLNLAPLDNAAAHLREAARHYDQAYARTVAAGASVPSATRDSLNDLLRGLEQQLTDPRGLPGRPWYRHLITAPGLFTGYGAKTLPGVREAIEQDHWEQANAYAALTAQALERYSAQLERAAALLQPSAAQLAPYTATPGN